MASSETGHTTPPQGSRGRFFADGDAGHGGGNVGTRARVADRHLFAESVTTAATVTSSILLAFALIAAALACGLPAPMPTLAEDFADYLASFARSEGEFGIAAQHEAGQLGKVPVSTEWHVDVNRSSQEGTAAPIGATCEGFFTVFAAVWNAGKPAKPTAKASEQLAYFSAQLDFYNRAARRRLTEPDADNAATAAGQPQHLLELRVYVTAASAPSAESVASFAARHNAVRFVEFEPEALLLQCGFEPKHLAEMRTWKEHTRMSDVLRICIALKRDRGTYVDLDIVLLDATPARYQTVHIPVGVWNDRGPALEVSNSMFCLTAAQLESNAARIRFRIERRLALNGGQVGREGYGYTELGPDVFQDQWLHGHAGMRRVPRLAQPNPWSPTVEYIVDQTCAYRMNHLHLTGAVRKALRPFFFNYTELVHALRCLVAAPPLDFGDVAAIRDPHICRCDPTSDGQPPQMATLPLQEPFVAPPVLPFEGLIALVGLVFAATCGAVAGLVRNRVLAIGSFIR